MPIPQLGIHRYFPYVCFPTIRWNIKKLGKEASDEQRAKLNRRQSLTLLDGLEEIESPVIPDSKSVSKRKRTSLELLEGLD